MKTGTESKLKFKQLQRKLDLPLWQARGLLDTLWTFVRDNCPAGDIGRFTDDEIAIGIDWRGCAASLIAILVETRWLDPSPTARLVVHDWREHCEDSVHKTLVRKTECFWDGSTPSLTRFSIKERRGIEAAYKRAFQNANERLQTPQNAPTEPNRTEPYLALPGETEERAFARSPLDSSIVDWSKAIAWVEALAKRVPPKTDKDRRQWFRYAAMALTMFDEAWLLDSAEAVIVAPASRQSPQAHFVGVLKSKAAERGVDAETFNGIARRIDVPDEILNLEVVKCLP